MRAFVVSDLAFSTPSQETGSGKRLWNDPFCVAWDVKPQLNQSINLYHGAITTSNAQQTASMQSEQNQNNYKVAENLPWATGIL